MIADTLSYFSAVEKIGWLAETIPQEGGRLYDPRKNNSVNRSDESFSAAEKAAFKSRKGAKAKEVQVAASWPKTGVIQLENVWMKYAPTAPYALKGVTFKINHGEKVRAHAATGNGKSDCVAIAWLSDLCERKY
jgi:ATP-binding cassette, subfamily C (CFTR/MRP), member 1